MDQDAVAADGSVTCEKCRPAAAPAEKPGKPARERVPTRRTTRAPAPEKKPFPVAIAAGAGAVVLAAVGLWFAFRSKHEEGPPPKENPSPTADAPANPAPTPTPVVPAPPKVEPPKPPPEPPPDEVKPPELPPIEPPPTEPPKHDPPPTGSSDSISANDLEAIRKAEGKKAVVEGTVAHAATAKSGKVMWITFNNDKEGFEAVIFQKKFAEFEAKFGDLSKLLPGKTVAVHGKVSNYQGRLQIVLDETSQLEVK